MALRSPNTLANTFKIEAAPKGVYALDITYRPAKFEDLEEAERVAQEAGNELRVRHGARPSPAPPPVAFSEMLPRGGSRQPLGRGTW